MSVDVDGLLCRVWNGKVMYTPHMNWGQGVFLEIGESRWDLVDHIGGNVIASSVSGGVALRCTGEKDKNGRLVYKGDTVKVWYNDYPEEVSVGKVWWFNCYYPAFDIYVPSKRTATGFESYSDEYNTFSHPEIVFEVIGNIYENPELLEVDRE